jgi:hypothetical protein
VILINNPPPQPGKPDPRGQVQHMVYPDDHPDPKLHGQPKGMKQVLIKWGIIWDTLLSKSGHRGPMGTCQDCKKSEQAKDAEVRITAAAMMGDEVKEIAAMDVTADASGPANDWCCMSCVMSLQSDFKSEKPFIQRYIEEHGHKCIFLPKFHCELNPIEMVWGYAKYHESYFYSTSVISYMTISQAIGWQQMASSRLPGTLSQNVWTHAISSPPVAFFEKYGALWMLMSMHHCFIIYNYT